MFSKEILAANLAALERIQGQRPELAALDGETTRAVPDAQAGLRVEIRTVDGGWHPLGGARPDAALSRQWILVGPGLGYALDDLERSGRAGKVVAIEPDAGVAVLLLARRDWRTWIEQGNLRLLTGPRYVGASACSRWLDGGHEIPVVVNPTLAAHRRATADAARTVADRIVAEAASNEIARRRFAGPYLLQTLGNMHLIEREANVSVLDGAFTGAPAVVVGAGPSLDRNVDELAGVQDRAVIIAADTALRPLLAGGVRPNLVVAADPSELNARHLAGVTRVDDVALIAEGSLHPSAFGAFAGRTFVFKVSEHEPWRTLQTLGIDRGTLRAWGSVVTPALDLALRMGCDPVLFAGLDLAYTGLRPYCRHTIYYDMWQSYIAAGCTWDQLVAEFFKGQPYFVHPDVNGEPVRTASHLFAFRQWILEQVALRRDRMFINATGGGILYGAGLGQATLNDTLAERPTLNDVRVTLARLHDVGVDQAAPLIPAIRSAIQSDADGVTARWIGFSSGTLTAQTIRRVLATAFDCDHVS